jgi:hypothetical protein
MKCCILFSTKRTDASVECVTQSASPVSANTYLRELLSAIHQFQRFSDSFHITKIRA